MITTAEWHIMAVIWANQGCEAMTVFHLLNEELEWSLSTIKTLLARLVKKGYLTVEKEGKTFHYVTTVTKAQVVADKVVEDFNLICRKDQGSILQAILPQLALSKQNVQDVMTVLHDLQNTAPDTVSCKCAKGQCTCQRG